MRGEFIDFDDPRWLEFLDGVEHDIYHLPAYAALSLHAEEEGSRALAYLVEESKTRCLIPLVERPVPAQLGSWGGWTDLASPYGYASPLLQGDPTKLALMLRLFAGDCRERKSVAAFLRSHPLLGPSWAERGELGWGAGLTSGTSGRPHSSGETVWIDLERSEEQLNADLRTDHRRGLRKLEKLGFHWSFDDWSLYEDFVRIYRRTMERVGADQAYFFPDVYFKALNRLLGEKVHLVSVLTPEGDVAAAGLFFHEGEILQYHLGGSVPELMKLAPSKLCIKGAIALGRDLGARKLHLGGGLGAQKDPLMWFKLGFSKLVSTYCTFEIVADREAYAALSFQAGAAGALESDESFFPSYRATPRRQPKQVGGEREQEAARI